MHCNAILPVWCHPADPQLHQSYADYVVSLWYSARGLTRPVLLEDGSSAEEGEALSMEIDQVASGVFDDAFVREELEQAVGQTIRWHLRDVRFHG